MRFSSAIDCISTCVTCSDDQLSNPSDRSTGLLNFIAIARDRHTMTVQQIPTVADLIKHLNCGKSSLEVAPTTLAQITRQTTKNMSSRAMHPQQRKKYFRPHRSTAFGLGLLLQTGVRVVCPYRNYRPMSACL